jgi:hypothetical protein
VNASSGQRSRFAAALVPVTASVAMSVAALFNNRSDAGTPFGIAAGVFGGVPGGAGLNASIGIMLILITLQSSCF